MECWKDIKGYEGIYQVSDQGNVRSLDRVEVTSAGWSRRRAGQVLRLGSGNGQKRYARVALGARTYRLVHRLVASAFIPNIDNYPHVNHKDKNTQNNMKDNLEWVTPTMNSVHASGVQFSLTNGSETRDFRSTAEAATFLSSNGGNVSRLVNKRKYHHIKGWRLCE